MNHMKTNQKFLEAFISLESFCAEKLGITTAGVSEYITRLTEAKMAIGKEATLEHLRRYRTLRNRLVHENGALRSLGDISKADVKWIKSFEKSVRKNKDPLSLYYKKSNDQKRKKKMIFTFVTVIIIAILAAAAYLFTQGM
jgi:uncharacterized protein YutE (UPF0331/DUF86 family)